MKKSGLFLVLVNIVLFFQQGMANEAKFITPHRDSLFQQTYCWQPETPFRPLLALDGEWEYSTDEKKSFKKVTLPASCDYWGTIVFRKTYVPDSTFTDHFFRLVCYGINNYCRIFVNKKFIASHSGGYSSFAFDIPPGLILVNQKNSIEINVDTRLDSKNSIPHQFQPGDVEHTAGIFRSLYFLGIPELSIENIAHNYQLSQDLNQCDLTINFDLKDRINNSPDQASQKDRLGTLQYDIEIFNPQQDRTIFHVSKEIDTRNYTLTREISTQLSISQPQLWSPESPARYGIRIQLIQGRQVIDQSVLSIGIKQIDFRDGDIYLNGNRYILKGVNWAENYLVSSGALFDRSQLLRDLAMVKQLHANALRVLHHPAHPILTELCDSLGLFLLQEIPIDWTPIPHLAAENFVGNSSDYFYEIVNRDRNHVSVFAWGIGGHFQLADSTTQNLIKRMTQRLSGLTALPFYTWDSNSEDSIEPDLNIINGISLLNLKKDQIRNRLSKWKEQNHANIKLVLSYGSPQLGVATTIENNALFEEYQALQIVDAWRAISNFPGIDGYFITSLSDFQGNYSATIFRNCLSSNLRPFGLMDYNRKKRVSFEIVRSLYRGGKSRYKAGVDMKDESPVAFLIVGLGAILVFLFMVNSRRYFRENLKRIFIHPHGFYVDIRDGRKIPPSHTILIALFISIGCGLVVASFFSFFKYNLPIDHLLTILSRTSELKSQLCHLIWNPELLIAFFSLITLFLFFLLALYFKFIALVTRARCSFAQCFTIPFWLGGNLIIFVPPGMVLLRLFQYGNIFSPIGIFILIIVAWFFIRVVKGMRVMFVWTFRRSFIFLIATILIIFSAIFYYYQSHYALIDYLKFYYQIYGVQIFTAHLY